VTAQPFSEDWQTPFAMPPFDRIRTEDFRPAFDAAMERHRVEIEALVTNPAAPDFANTIEALELAGQDLIKVSRVFYNLTGTLSDEPLRAVERDLAPLLARHRSAIFLDPRLFARVDAVFAKRATLGLDAEQQRLLERVHKGFVRAGARFSDDERKRLAEITERLATLGTTFAQNVLKDESDYVLLLDGEADLAGLSADFRASAAALAESRGHSGKHAVGLSRGHVETFLTFSSRRDLRETLFRAFIMRGENGGDTDNRSTIAETLALRSERAKMLGYDTYAAYKLDDTMAGSPEAVRDLLDRVWVAGRARAHEEAAQLQAMIEREGGNFELAAHDWRYYAEKVRRADFALDDNELRPYFPLERMIEAAFYVAGELFGLSFVERTDLPVYHPDARSFEIRDRTGKHLALFIGDYFARPSKRSGAWMSAFRSQQKLGGEQRPIIVNVLNVPKPAESEPALLSLDEARTLFHEFGHALHGMLSDVTYPTLAGTAVSSDFVELPSQLFEHWLLRPEVLRRYARHVTTDEVIPESLLNKVLAARTFNQGFATVEYCASTAVDLDYHLADPTQVQDPIRFEAQVLERIGMPREIAMRHRSPHFTHVFAGEGYASGYYSYLWSEVLDADAFAAFEETGDVFDKAVATRLRDYVYAAGNLRDPKDAYRGFRGRLPSVDALLKKRGLMEA
jgi:peptidyl-dipeptidase Dcp